MSVAPHPSVLTTKKTVSEIAKCPWGVVGEKPPQDENKFSRLWQSKACRVSNVTSGSISLRQTHTVLFSKSSQGSPWTQEEEKDLRWVLEATAPVGRRRQRGVVLTLHPSLRTGRSTTSPSPESGLLGKHRMESGGPTLAVFQLHQTRGQERRRRKNHCSAFLDNLKR